MKKKNYAAISLIMGAALLGSTVLPAFAQSTSSVPAVFNCLPLLGSWVSNCPPSSSSSTTTTTVVSTTSSASLSTSSTSTQTSTQSTGSATNNSTLNSMLSAPQTFTSPGKLNAPVAFDGSLTVTENGSSANSGLPLCHSGPPYTSTPCRSSTLSQLSAEDLNLPPQPLTYSIVAGPSSGTVSSFSATAGTFIYTPNTNFAGSDSFTFMVTNTSGLNSNVATESITVNPIGLGSPNTNSSSNNGAAVNTPAAPSQTILNQIQLAIQSLEQEITLLTQEIASLFGKR